MAKFETELTIFPVCPYCGHENRDLCDLQVEEEKPALVYCDRCGILMKVLCQTTTVYTTYKVPKSVTGETNV